MEDVHIVGPVDRPPVIVALGPPQRDRERGAGVVEWLGISALSIALLATIFTALNAVGLDLVDHIRTTLGI
jgi:hypothetical protein